MTNKSLDLNSEIKILLLEDNLDDTMLIKRVLKKSYSLAEIHISDDEATFDHLLKDMQPDIVLSDYHLPGFSGLEALQIFKKKKCDCPFIFVTGAIGEEMAAETIAKGADAFLLKSSLDNLPALIDKTLQERKMERLLERKAELEKVNAELEMFAYVASHDLKAPLINIKGLLSLIKETCSLNNGSEELVDKVVATADRMEHTISVLNEVITLKKNLQLERQQVKFSTAIKAVSAGLETQINNSKAVIKSNFSKCEDVSYPPVHLQHILQNLLSNAIKYRRNGHASVINISTERKNGSICLVVRDNGPGIDLKSHGKRLFGLFQRFSLDIEGKGIGLYITKSIVESYGGRIEVDSKMNNGTTFRLYLSQ